MIFKARIKKQTKVADEYAKKDKLAVDDSWKNNYNWSGKNNTGEMLSEKNKSELLAVVDKKEGKIVCTMMNQELFALNYIAQKNYQLKMD